MRLVALTYGTEGDTRPLAALCRALMDAGHDVVLLSDGATLGSARDLGVPHTALSGDIRQAMRPDTGMTSVVAGKNNLNDTAKILARIANENAAAWMREVLDVAAGCDGLIVAGLAAYIGFSAAEKLAVPVIGAGMIPLTPTAAFPSPFLGSRSVPRWLNRLSYRLVAAVLWRAFREATNSVRATVGLEPGDHIWTGHPMLYGISPTLLPTPADWPNNAWMCGQWVHPTPDWDAPQSLQDFLAAGDAPIYVGSAAWLALTSVPCSTLWSPQWLASEPCSIRDGALRDRSGCRQISMCLATLRTIGYFPGRPLWCITADPGRRTPLPGPGCLRLCCPSQPISSSGLSSCTARASRRTR